MGGVSGGEGPCRPGLQGPYCQVCEVRGGLECYSPKPKPKPKPNRDPDTSPSPVSNPCASPDQVRDDSVYYNAEESRCMPCEGDLLLTVLALTRSQTRTRTRT